MTDTSSLSPAFSQQHSAAPPAEPSPLSIPAVVTQVASCAAVTPALRSALVKAPKPPRQNVLKHTTFVGEHFDAPSPMAPSLTAPAVSQIYDSILSHDDRVIDPDSEVDDDTPDLPKDANLLPPPFGAGYIFPRDTTISPFEQEGVRVIFSVDSRCEPYNIIRRDVALKAGLTPYSSRTRLALGNLDTIVDSNEMVYMQLRIVINDRPRLFFIRCVVWDTLAGELIISNQTALANGLTIFCHSSALRDAIVGREALSSGDEHDTIGDIPPAISTIIGTDEDQEIMETISPVESLRQAMITYTSVNDPWVNEELNGPLAAVFGPLPPEPANVPPLEFDVDEPALRKFTYENTQPIKLGATSPHGQDVIDAQWDELKGFNVLRDAYPDIGPVPLRQLRSRLPNLIQCALSAPQGTKEALPPLMRSSQLFTRIIPTASRWIESSLISAPSTNS